MNPIETMLRAQGFVQLDGGLSTELEDKGADLDHDLWSAVLLAEQPDRLFDAHLAFLRGGADVIASGSYQASIPGFLAAGYSTRQAERLLRLSIKLACNARLAWQDSEQQDERCSPLVAASLGPFGAYRADGSEYHGNYGVSESVLRDFHRPRMELMADTEADLMAFETLPSLQEAGVVLELLEDFPTVNAWISFSCRDERSICHGELFSEAVDLARQSERVIAVGVNCTAPDSIEALLASVDGNGAPLMCYPNSGESWNAAAHQWQGMACSRFPLEQWYDRGALLLGGCCRTRAGDIPAMRQQITEHIKQTVPD